MTAVLAIAICSTPLTLAQPSRPGGIDDELAAARNRLLLTYSKFKSYGLTNPQDVYSQKLSPDRRALFDAVTRALFVGIENADGSSTKRVITLIEEVRGIWGMRPGEKEGRRLFRVSARFDAGARATLKASSNIPQAVAGHVLMPVAVGGDDDSKFTAFEIKAGGDVVTFRQRGQRPKLQLSLLTNDERVGEIDLDFDAGCGPWPIKDCHCKPSNSDVGSHVASGEDNHLVMFNARVPLFSSPLSAAWKNTAAHCKASY